MEDLDSRLFITGVEVSCWQDQTETDSKYLFSTNLWVIFHQFIS